MGVDSQVSGVVPDDVWLELTSRGMFKDEVEHFVLHDSPDVLTRKSCKECLVEPHLKVAVLGEHTRGADGSGRDFSNSTKNLSVEGLFKHHRDQVRFNVEGFRSCFVSKLDAGYLGRSVFVFICHLNSKRRWSFPHLQLYYTT